MHSEMETENWDAEIKPSTWFFKNGQLICIPYGCTPRASGRVLSLRSIGKSEIVSSLTLDNPSWHDFIERCKKNCQWLVSRFLFESFIYYDSDGSREGWGLTQSVEIEIESKFIFLSQSFINYHIHFYIHLQYFFHAKYWGVVIWMSRIDGWLFLTQICHIKEFFVLFFIVFLVN